MVVERSRDAAGEPAEQAAGVPVRGSRVVRIGVVGAGLVAQAMHLHYVAHLRERFELVAIAEPSAAVREGLGARYGVPRTYADYRGVLEDGGVEAIVVCSPNGTHAEIVLAALDAGVHVLVEKPLCITLEDADRIVAARDRAGRVVQVGYMKRHDPAYERMLAELPATAADLRYVSVVVRDPGFEPFFGPEDVMRGRDVPEGVIAEVRRAEAEQVEAAVGSGSPEVVRAFSEGYLGSLVHDVNVVHGLLERMGEPLPPEIVGGAWWDEGRALTGAARLTGGARWDSAWIELLDVHEYREVVALYFRDSVRSLTFPSPWLRQSPTVYERSGGDGDGDVARAFRSYEESFARELQHFHACVVDGADCRTPPEQARVDMEALTRMFLASAARA